MLAAEPQEPQGPEGRCADDAHCQSGACGYFDGIGRCGRGCDPRLGHYQCPEGQGCVVDQMGNGMCREDGDTGTNQVGESCGQASECVHGICQDGRCTTWCGGDGWCPAIIYVMVGRARRVSHEPGAGGGQQTGLGRACGSASGAGLEWLLLLVRRRRVKLRS